MCIIIIITKKRVLPLDFFFFIFQRNVITNRVPSRKGILYVTCEQIDVIDRI